MRQSVASERCEARGELDSLSLALKTEGVKARECRQLLEAENDPARNGDVSPTLT